MDLRIPDSQAASSVVTGYLQENQKRFDHATFHKAWLSGGEGCQVWDVQGIARVGRLIPLLKKDMAFRYQVDACRGTVIGFDKGFRLKK